MINIFDNTDIIKNDSGFKKLRSELDIWELNVPPVENPKSECFECSAGMCSYDLCPDDQYKYNQNQIC